MPHPSPMIISCLIVPAPVPYYCKALCNPCISCLGIMLPSSLGMLVLPLPPLLGNPITPPPSLQIMLYPSLGIELPLLLGILHPLPPGNHASFISFPTSPWLPPTFLEAPNLLLLGHRWVSILRLLDSWSLLSKTWVVMFSFVHSTASFWWWWWRWIIQLHSGAQCVLPQVHKQRGCEHRQRGKPFKSVCMFTLVFHSRSHHFLISENLVNLLTSPYCYNTWTTQTFCGLVVVRCKRHSP